MILNKYISYTQRWVNAKAANDMHVQYMAFKLGTKVVDIRKNKPK